MEKTILLTLAMQEYVCSSIIIKTKSILELHQHLDSVVYNDGVFYSDITPIIYRYGDAYRLVQPASTWDPDLYLLKKKKTYCYLLPNDINHDELELIVSYYRKVRSARSVLSGSDSVDFMYKDKSLSLKICESYGHPSSATPPVRLIKKLLGGNSPSRRTIDRIKEDNGLVNRQSTKHLWNSAAKKQKPQLPTFEKVIKSFPKNKQDKARKWLSNEIEKGRKPLTIYKEIDHHDLFKSFPGDL